MIDVRTIGIIGYGNFGAFLYLLLGKFVSGIAVRIFSPDKQPDGKLFFSFEEVARCDVVVLAVPIRAYEEVIKSVVPLMRHDGILVDIATVKMHTVHLLQKYAAHLRWVAIHPMFGPESVAERGGDVDGLRIAVTKHTISKSEFNALRKLFEGLGFQVVSTTPKIHDGHLAQTLFVTHVWGDVFDRAGFGPTEIDTVSFGYLMKAMNSVKHDKQLFIDVYKYNPFCKAVLERLDTAMHETRMMLYENGH
jgi:prephenate dehydrogenase